MSRRDACLRLRKRLSTMGACYEARSWIRECGFASLEEAWYACPSGSWLRWILLALVDCGVAGIGNHLTRPVRANNTRGFYLPYALTNALDAEVVRRSYPFDEVLAAWCRKWGTP